MSITQTLKIAVVCGGESAEAEVSRVSAKGVVAALKKNYSHVAKFELGSELYRALADYAPDVVFPVLHGPPGEDGTFQGYLEILGYLYVGSDVHSSAFAMDKIVAKRLFASIDLPLVEDMVITSDCDVEQTVLDIENKLGPDVVIKPARQGSALGVTLVNSTDQMPTGINSAFAFDRQLLVERRILGREITVGVIDTDADTNAGSAAFPVIEVTTPEDSWYDFEHRYTSGLSEHVMPAVLSAAQTERLQKIAIKAHQVLGCRDLSRADFIVAGDDEEYLLEVNTLPGMTPTSLYPDGAKGFGLSFPALVSHLVERAANRR